MKRFKYWAAYLVVLTMIFTSCSKEENDVMDNPQEQDLIQLQFGPILNDFVAKQSKDHYPDPPGCNESDPSYVHVALQYPNDSWVDDKDGDNGEFIEIPINYNANLEEWETAFAPELGLPADTYSLEYFIVYNALDEVIWVAPRSPGVYAEFVDDPLPQPIVLAAGTKPYVSVDVLCFDTRQEDAYGYIFFELDTYTAKNTYCIFVNYCDREGTGREYPAKFMVEAWRDAYDGIQPITINPNMNVISAGPAASVLCFNLPVLEGNDTHFIRVTVMDHQLLPYDVDEQNPPVREFEVSQADVDGQLLLTPKYDHIRMNCDEDNGNGDECLTDPTGPDCDPDGDGLSNREEDAKGTDPNDPDSDGDSILDGADLCPLVEAIVDENEDGCEDDLVDCATSDCALTTSAEGDCYTTTIDLSSLETIHKITGDMQLELRGNKGQLDPNVLFGTADVEISNNMVNVILDTPEDFDKIKGYKVTVWPSDINGDAIVQCANSICENNIEFVEGNQGPLSTLEFDQLLYSYPIYINIEAIICEDVPFP